MLRLHFTGDDLSRIRFVSRPDPLWETVLSITLLGSGLGQSMFGPWRARARTELRRLSREHLRLLRYLAPPRGAFPDFLTPAQASEGLEEGIEAILATPRRRLRQELTVLPGVPSCARPLADGDPEKLAELGEALRAYHHAVIAPYQSQMQALVDDERAIHSRSLLNHGSEGLLAGLKPTMRWNPPVLEADYPLDHDIHLAGRGLLLIPSAFCWRFPITFIDPGLSPALVYPVSRMRDWWTGSPTGDGPRKLANLLGNTRAACLRVIEHGCTTGELARRTGVAPSSASQHASTLREAGLIATTRLGNAVMHTLTPLGAALLNDNLKP
ncbi:ArsR/SmtB family transcription factor [Streptosporangium roseum]|uniref:Transcriptional regulator, ArsR family n=1 Tax=Streptosporangium roseum (strain ATCC 12428 / DSM 43021 / JCM 3005 / KCTC 9067 / NCIMB 10171 / NRRL 2505 / NI 9100) TaxID=479432 RepID=D2B1S8_STRRD|nr:winged helix-turn-helix domain-containing protein [Streptosporangium roseum]ACZ87380.1 putative transcriptional regulator, ArsR family [Streptosporangium roseum DSM 43021]